MKLSKDDSYHFWQISTLNKVEKKLHMNYIIIDFGNNKKNYRSIIKDYDGVDWAMYREGLPDDSLVIYIPAKFAEKMNDQINTDRANGRGTEFELVFEKHETENHTVKTVGINVGEQIAR